MSLWIRAKFQKQRFSNICGGLLLQLATCFSLLADEFPPSPAPLATFESIGLDPGIESLSESHRMAEQLNRLQRENEFLSRRLDSLQSSMSQRELSDQFLIPPSPGESSTMVGALQPVDAHQTGYAGLYDSLHCDDNSGLKSLFDSLNSPLGKKSKPWYEKMTIRGYSQIRLGRALSQDPQGAAPSLFSDRSITGETGTFSIRRARLILSEEVSDHLFLYFQSDFANNPADGTSTFFAQIRDLYGDIYLDLDKVHRIRVGQSKLPWGFEEMQSSGNRIPLDRSDAIDTGDSPNQRDLGTFYYWTPVDKQRLLKELVDGGLKGSGNYGIIGFGMYNGQGGSELDLNRSLHTVARFTWPFQLSSGQAVEISIQGYTGKKVVAGAPIRPLGLGASTTPAGVGYDGFLDQRVAGSFVWYPQPLGFQAEWNVGVGPGLNNAQTAIEVRSLSGGYAMAMYKLDTPNYGIFIPFARYQHYRGSYKSIANAPYGTHDEYSLGMEWQIRKELELVVEYGFVDGVSLNAIDEPGALSYKQFRGQLLRSQLQINY